MIEVECRQVAWGIGHGRWWLIGVILRAVDLDDEPQPGAVPTPQDPDGPEAEDPQEREVDPPELARAGDANAEWPPPAQLLLLGDEVAPADKVLSKGLASRPETQDRLRQVHELPRAELRLLDVQPHDLLFDVRGRPVPGAAPARSADRVATLHEEALDHALERSAEPLQAARGAPVSTASAKRKASQMRPAQKP